MVHRALLAAGPALRAHEPLLGIVHRELFPAMASAARAPSLGVINGVCQVRGYARQPGAPGFARGAPHA